jgi:hypothetical protein
MANLSFYIFTVDVAFWTNSLNLNAASSRLRVFLVIKFLRRFKIKAWPYIKFLIKPRVLLLSKRYDSKSIKHALKLKEKFGTKIVLDICDNHFYYEFESKKWDTRKLNLIYAIDNVDCLIVSSNYLKSYVIQHCKINPGSIFVIGDYIEPPMEINLFNKIFNPLAFFNYLQLKTNLRKFEIRLVWYGNHGSSYSKGGMEDVLLIKNEIEALSKKWNVSLTIISNNKNKFNFLFKDVQIPKFYVPWNRRFISRFLCLHDICVIPISKNPFTLAKSENRLTFSLSHGLSVYATGIPSYLPFNDFVILDDWTKLIKYNKGKKINYSHQLSNHNEEISNLWKSSLFFIA